MGALRMGSFRLMTSALALVALGLPSFAHAITAAQREECTSLMNQEALRREREARTGITTSPIAIPGHCGALNVQEDASTAATAPRASATDFNSLCGDVLRNNGRPAQPAPAREGEAAPTPASQSDLQQKLQHCQAAESAKRAKSAASVTSKVWMATAGVCTAECFTTLGLGGGGFCTMSTIATTGVDMAVTREFTQALTSIAGLAMNPGFKFGGQAAANAGKKFNGGACIAAATAGVQAAMKMKSARDSQKVFDQEIASIRQLLGTTARSDFAAVPRGPGALGNPYGTATAGGGGARRPLGNGVAERGDPCSAAEGGDTGAALQCAAKTDPSIPTEMIAKPGFLNAFESTSGLGFGDLLTNENATAGQQLTAAMAGGMGSQGVATLAAAVKKVETAVGDDPGAMMASAGGGGGGAAGGASEDDALAQAMANLLKGVNGEKEEQPGVNETAIERANRTRSPASIAEDPSLSLFERVTFRYTSVSRQLFAPPPAQVQMRGGDRGAMPTAYR